MSLKQNKDDLLQMMETDMATNTVAECNVCNGKDECLSDDNQAECPFYADNACFIQGKEYGTQRIKVQCHHL